MTFAASGVPEPVTDDLSDWTPIQIEAPLPNTVALALIQAIGKMWPEAVIQGGSRQYALNFKVPPVNPEDLDQEFADQIRKNVDEDHEDLTFLGFRQGWVAFAPPEEMCLELGQIAHAIFTAHQPEAINYVEWQVRTGNDEGDPTYDLSIAKSKGQAPGALWHKEKEETERLRALLEKHGIDPDEEV